MTESFEAKKHAYRQTQDGIVISFTIHPNDMPEHLALAPLGTRFGVAVAEIGDDEKPKESDATPAGPVMGARSGATPGETGPKDRKPFSSLPLSQQAALRCQDNDFKLFLNASNAEDAAEKVRQHCGITSRSQLDVPQMASARHLWGALESNYQSWLTTQRYGEARRG